MSTLNARTRRDLEFDKVLEKVQAQAASALGRAAVAALRPYERLEGIEAELDRVQACIEAIQHESFFVPAIEDVRPVLAEAGSSTTVDPAALWDVLAALEAVRLLRGQLEALEARYEPLRALAQGLETFPELEGFIRRSVDEQGEIRDDATPTLRQLTRRRAAAEERARKKLEKILHGAATSGLIQEPVITRRSGRLVIPVKSHLRHQLAGIVQDSSGSGQTLYLEPTSVVEENNLIRELEGEIRDEKLRLLQELTAKLREEVPALENTLENYAWIDSVYARARYALSARAVRPELNVRGFIRLRGARHPLIDPERVVPIDLSLGEDHRGVVITGPNTGGKTVALKTVGVLTLMAQAGIPVPAEEGSVLSVFELVRSDIGDEQSIEQSLSTFSSHLRNIVSLLAEVRDCSARGGLSLVILDELGAGTDPQEGTALAITLLETLLDLRVRLLVTTHYGALKRFAYGHPRLKNASVAFDLETLAPTYRLLEGVPGASNAFLIAERLGLEPALIARAKAQLDEGQVRTEDVIRGLQAERAALEEERLGFREARERLQAQFQAYRDKLAQLEAERERALSEELRALEAELRRARRALEAALHAARRERDATALRERFQEVLETDRALARARQRLERRHEPAPLARLTELRPGDWVRVQGLRKPGQVVHIEDEKRIQVEVEGLRVWASLSDLRRAEPMPAARPSRARVLSSAPAPPLELNVRGQTTAEALRAVDHYLNQLLLAGREQGAILHGKGTGALRRAIRDHLKRFRWVKAVHAAPPAQGGDGVTIVELG